MSVTIEFFGIARQRAGIDHVDVDAHTIREALEQLSRQLPHWGAACLVDGQLRPELLASVNARTFVTSPDHPLQDGDHLLILAADVGG